MRIVCISDTHDWDLTDLNIPDGDILVHTGDATGSGTVNSIITFNKQLGKLPHKHKIFTPGNHDWLFERDFGLAQTILTNAILLKNSGTIIEGLKFWGSPATPRFFNWAFNFDRGPDIKRFWDIIPDDTDVLMTHGPPYGIGDYVRGKFVGCQDLLDAVRRVKPKLHVFGHIHYSYGDHGLSLGTQFVNASTCDEQYRPINPPIVIDL